MIYHKYELNILYLPGSDFKITKSGSVVSREPTSKDIDYIKVFSPDGFNFNESSIKDAKETILKLETIK